MNIDELIKVRPEMLYPGVLSTDRVTDSYRSYAVANGHKPVTQLYRLSFYLIVTDTGEVVGELKGLSEVCSSFIHMDRKYTLRSLGGDEYHVSADDFRQLEKNCQIINKYNELFMEQLGEHADAIRTAVKEIYGVADWCEDEHANAAHHIKDCMEGVLKVAKKEIK